MKTLIIYIFLIISILSCKTKANTSEIKREISQNNLNSIQNKKTIEVKIFKNGKYYLNNEEVIYESIIRKIDSLGELGYDSTKILIRTEKEAKISETIKIMELANKNNKKVKLGISIN